MAPLDRALSLREQHLTEALEILTEKHGAHSETVAIIRERLEAVHEELLNMTASNDVKERNRSGDVVTMMGGPKVKDAAPMFIILGGILIMALGGISTLFVLMMAAKW